MKTILTLAVSGCLLSTNFCLGQNCTPPPSGVVSWWRAEGNALDGAGGNNGTLSGGTTFSPGRAGQAFNFSEVYSGVGLGNPPSLQLQTFTIEAWVKRASETACTQDPAFPSGPPYYAVGAILCYGNGGYAFSIRGDGRLDFNKVGVAAVFSSTVRVTDTNFHHVAVTKSGSSVVFYVDGVAESTTFGDTFSFTTPVAIGARGPDLASSFWGLIDELAVYNRVLATNEIQAIYNAGSAGKCAPRPPPPPTNGLVAYYPFNGNANDASGHGNNGTVNGATLTSDRFGSPNSAYSFDGVSSDILVPETLFGPTDPAWTVSLWITTDNGPYTVQQELFYKSCVNGEVSLDIQAGLISFRPNLATSGYMSVTAPVRSNSVIHLVGVYQKGQSISLYTNGVLATNSVVPNENLHVQALSLQSALGAYHYGSSPSYHFRGVIDDVVVYNRALSSAEIQQLYNPQPAVPPQITTQPQDQTVVQGDTATFTVAASGTPAPNYQWRFNGTNIAGATGSALVLTNVQTTNAGNYSVTVYNYAGATNSSNAVLTVHVPPLITAQPQGAIGYWGGTVQFGAGVDGTPPFSYQWYKEAFAISWGTNVTLTLTNLDFPDAGNYWVSVTNVCGSTNSASALLVVNPAGVWLGMHPFLTITGTVGKTFGIEYSTQVSQTNPWTALTNFTLTQPVQEWIDTSVDAVATPKRFYRVVPIP
jgi:hypothetical protein